MNTIRLRDLNLYDVGSTIQLVGALYQEYGKTYLVVLPDEAIADTEPIILKMDLGDWQTFLRQTDLVETEILQNDGTGIKKAIVRKTQRMIDGSLQARIWKRDEWKCRYCGRDDVQLTVDHIILWEELGATIEENLLSSCKKCNRTRGNMQYEDWLKSKEYEQLSQKLRGEQLSKNRFVLQQLPYLRTLKVKNQRSR